MIDRPSGRARGILSLMSIVPDHGRIEIGHVAFGAAMQRTPKSTEAVYLLGKAAFELGNRRLEWKCNNANARLCVPRSGLALCSREFSASTWW